MNNEELAKSLRTEINTYLKNTVADLQQEIAEMQERINADIERQRGELENSFSSLLAKGAAANVDDDFARLVSEHLQIAYEDGSREAAENAPPPEPVKEPASYGSIREAINEISTQTTQAEILKSLVKHASGFAPRGAFFIVKSDHLVGWRMLGSEVTGGDESIREVFLSSGGDTLLGESIRQNAVQRSEAGGRAEDAQYLQKLNFGNPREMVAVPLVVRGRGVAVLYADSGANDSTIQTDALETLVRVASLTVELLAAAKNPAKPPANNHQKAAPAAAPVTAPAVVETAAAFDFQTPATKPKTTDYAAMFDNPVKIEEAAPQTFEPDFSSTVEPKPFETFSFDTPQSVSQAEEAPAKSNDFQEFNPPPSRNETAFSFESTIPSFNAPQIQTETAPGMDNQTAAPRKFGERNLELPIDVPEDERRLHNDARRFARLLVSEIKLYNEQKVKEGRQAGDLYSRLREAVDRSREMYDKRVSPPVAARFDYFNYELVNTLAEGDETKLGGDYPGASV